MSNPVWENKVLNDSEFIASQSKDVVVNIQGCKNAAQQIYQSMIKQSYSTATWSSHELHPNEQNEETINWILTIDLLNFSFWSEEYDQKDTGSPDTQRFTVEYNEKPYTGYWSLVAAINKALDNNIPITNPEYWASNDFTKDVLQKVFESSTKEQVPLFDDRYNILKQAGEIIKSEKELHDSNTTYPFIDLFVKPANKSALKLVDIISSKIPSFNDISTYHSKTVHIMKRAQILVSDIWACFEGKSYGEFYDIDEITMFADYRVPQIIHSLDCITYSDELTNHIINQKLLNHGDTREVEIRGCSIWAVELIKREILLKDPNAPINSILIDYYLWDTAKSIQQTLGLEQMIPCHRTRSIFY